MVYVDNHDVRAKTRAMDADNAARTRAMDAKIATVKGLAESDNAPLTDMGPSNQEVSDSSGSDAMAVGGLVLGALGFLFGAASLGLTLVRGGARKSVAREISFGKDKGGVTEAKA